MPLIGPHVPEEIQEVRARRRAEILASAAPPTAASTAASAVEDGDSSSDDGFGPSLPGDALDDEEAERRAVELLNARATLDAPQKARGDDRSSWINVALGMKPDRGKQRKEINIPRHAKAEDESTEEPESRGPSLLDEHRSRKRKDDGSIQDFDRQVRGTGFSNAKVNEFLKHAKGMSDRFSRGS